MTSVFDKLPYEILDLILAEAAELNRQDTVTYSYGLTEAPQPLQHVKIERYIRGRRPEDSLRWDAASSIRQVNSRWRQWALGYAASELYIRRWRGSERWIESRKLETLRKSPSVQAVYRQPYNDVRETARCFVVCPDLAQHVRRLWFNGLYTFEANAEIFKILTHCRNLRSLSLPWVALRYGTADLWQKLLRRDDDGLWSLELMAINLTKSQLSAPANQVDNQALVDPRVSFCNLKKLKIFGNTIFKPVTDADLQLIARTATGLEALHVTGISSVSIAGIMSLVEASSSTLRVLEYSPLSADGFDHPDPDPNHSSTRSFPPSSSPKPQPHYCTILLSCPHLTDLSISIPSICPSLFSSPATVRWTGDLQVRAARICGHSRSALRSANGIATFKRILDNARELIDFRNSSFVPPTHTGTDHSLEIELFIGPYIFTPSSRLAHGNFDLSRALSDFTWPAPQTREVHSSSGTAPGLMPSPKGPYGHTGLYGKDLDPDPESGISHGSWSCVDEEVFFDGVRKGWVKF